MRPRFTLDDANAAYDQWGCNCGPAAIAAVCGLTLDELRPHLGDFEAKRYTNPTLMWQILKRVAPERWTKVPADAWPRWGLVRIQWGGPWMNAGVPMRARYRHTHWIGCCSAPLASTLIFDVNAMCVGGWVTLREWRDQLVPWLLGECEPKADGTWERTHVVEVDVASGGRS